MRAVAGASVNGPSQTPPHVAATCPCGGCRIPPESQIVDEIVESSIRSLYDYGYKTVAEIVQFSFTGCAFLCRGFWRGPL